MPPVAPICAHSRGPRVSSLMPAAMPRPAAQAWAGDDSDCGVRLRLDSPRLPLPFRCGPCGLKSARSSPQTPLRRRVLAFYDFCARAPRPIRGRSKTQRPGRREPRVSITGEAQVNPRCHWPHSYGGLETFCRSLGECGLGADTLPAGQCPPCEYVVPRHARIHHFRMDKARQMRKRRTEVLCIGEPPLVLDRSCRAPAPKVHA